MFNVTHTILWSYGTYLSIAIAYTVWHQEYFAGEPYNNTNNNRAMPRMWHFFGALSGEKRLTSPSAMTGHSLVCIFTYTFIMYWGWQFVWYVEHVSCFLQQPQQPSRAGISWKTGTEKTNAQGPIIIAITVHHLYGKLEKKNKQTKKGAQGPSNHHNYCIHHLYGKPGEKKNCA